MFDLGRLVNNFLFHIICKLLVGGWKSLLFKMVHVEFDLLFNVLYILGFLGCFEHFTKVLFVFFQLLLEQVSPNDLFEFFSSKDSDFNTPGDFVLVVHGFYALQVSLLYLTSCCKEVAVLLRRL